MIVGVMIDNWKLPIFRKHLDTIGYTYTEKKLTGEHTLIRISCEFIEKITPIIMAAHEECTKVKCIDCEDN